MTAYTKLTVIMCYQIVTLSKLLCALCSLSLTMVKTGAKLQIPGIKGGLVLIKMAVVT